MNRSIMLLVALALVAADPAPDEASKKEREKLQGVWMEVGDPMRSWPPINFDRGVMFLEITADKGPPT
jgi:hypothetical protein